MLYNINYPITYQSVPHSLYTTHFAYSGQSDIVDTWLWPKVSTIPEVHCIIIYSLEIKINFVLYQSDYFLKIKAYIWLSYIYLSPPPAVPTNPHSTFSSSRRTHSPAASSADWISPRFVYFSRRGGR